MRYVEITMESIKFHAPHCVSAGVQLRAPCGTAEWKCRRGARCSVPPPADPLGRAKPEGRQAGLKPSAGLTQGRNSNYS